MTTQFRLWRPQNPQLSQGNYHDLEKLSVDPAHSLATRDAIRAVRIITVTTNITLTSSHDMVLVDCTAGDITITIPAASAYPFKQYWIKKEDGSRHKVIVKCSGTDKLDNYAEWYITYRYDTMSIVSDSVDEWFHV